MRDYGLFSKLTASERGQLGCTSTYKLQRSLLHVRLIVGMSYSTSILVLYWKYSSIESAINTSYRYYCFFFDSRCYQLNKVVLLNRPALCYYSLIDIETPQ